MTCGPFLANVLVTDFKKKLFHPVQAWKLFVQHVTLLVVAATETWDLTKIGSPSFCHCLSTTGQTFVWVGPCAEQVDTCQACPLGLV